MTSDTSVQFDSILQDLFTIFKNADKNNDILTTKIPADFFESNSHNIIKSYQEFLGGKQGKSTDILSKFNRNKYSNSPYNLYHDIKVACCSIISKHKIGSQQYVDTDFFYKFSTELLLQELSRINVLLFDENIDESNDEAQSELFAHLNLEFNKISYSYSSANDEMITYVSKTEEPEQPTVSPYSNVYPAQTPVPTKQVKQPLFSSLLGKSSLDPNPTIVDDPYSIAKVIPVPKNSSHNNSTLESISAPSNKIPTPLDQNPTPLLQDFFHPIWYTIPVPTWLNYKSTLLRPANVTANQLAAPSALSPQENNSGAKPKLLVLQNRGGDAGLSSTTVEVPGDIVRSFAPNVDLAESIVTAAYKSRIWLQHLGFNEIEAIKKKYIKKMNSKEESKEPVEEEKVTPDVEEIEDIDTADIDDDEDDSDLEKSKSDVKEESLYDEIDEEIDESAMEIDLAKVVDWDPCHAEDLRILILEKKTITQSPTSLQRLISTNLIKLNRLRQERYLRSDAKNIALPNDKEKGLYNRISKLIEFAIQLYKINPGDFSFEFSKKLPVLTTEFCGTLPGMAASKVPAGYSSASQVPSSRLPSIRGPYKKKNK